MTPLDRRGWRSMTDISCFVQCLRSQHHAHSLGRPFRSPRHYWYVTSCILPPLSLTTNPRPRRRRRNLDLRRSQPQRHLRLHPLPHPSGPPGHAQNKTNLRTHRRRDEPHQLARKFRQRQRLPPHERALGAGRDLRYGHLRRLVRRLSRVAVPTRLRAPAVWNQRYKRGEYKTEHD